MAVDYTNLENIRLGKVIEERNGEDARQVLCFSIAYAIFTKTVAEIKDTKKVSEFEPQFLGLINNSLYNINELSPIDVSYCKNLTLKLTNLYNKKVNVDYNSCSNVLDLFYINDIFGLDLLGKINVNIAEFKANVNAILISKVFKETLANEIAAI